MSWLSIASILYGLLNILFGVLGYVNKDSLPSLIAGGLFGALVIVGATWATTNRKIGYGIVAVVSVFIFGRFFKPAFTDGQIYPGMVLAITSIVMLVLLAIGHFTDRKPVAGQPEE